MQQFLILYFFRNFSPYLIHCLFSSLDVSAAGSSIPWLLMTFIRLLYFQLWGHMLLLPVPGGPLAHLGAHAPLFPAWWTAVGCGKLVTFVYA